MVHNKIISEVGINMEKHKSYSAYAASLLSSLFIGFSFLFVKISLEFTTPVDLLAHRFIFAFVGVFAYKVITGTKLNISAKNIKYMVLVGLLYPVVYFALQTYAMLFISSSEAGIIQATLPVFTVIVARFFLKEKTGIIQNMGIILSVSGVIFLQIINRVSGDMSVVGTLLIISAVLTFTFYQMLSKKLMRIFSVFDISFGAICMGAVFMNAFAISIHMTGNTLHMYTEPLFNSRYLLVAAYLGVLSTFGTSILNIYSISKLSVTQVSVFNNFSTLITVIAGVVILKEAFTMKHFIGIVLVLAGVVLVNYFSEDGKKNNG